jgi:hypothetical protein
LAVGSLKGRGAGIVARRVEWLDLVVWRGLPFQKRRVTPEDVKTSMGVVVLMSPWRERVVGLGRVAERTR